MELSIIHSDIKNSEVRPNAEFNEYIKKVTQYNKSLGHSDLIDINCPGCNSTKTDKQFEKCGFEYFKCSDCYTIYVKRRPSQEQINQFYQNSDARTFWLDEIWQNYQDVRMDKIIKPLTDWIETSTITGLDNNKGISVAELLPHNTGLLEGQKKFSAFPELTLIDPCFKNHEQIASSNNIKVSSMNDSSQYDAICMIDLLDRTFNPNDIMKWANEHLKPGGICLLTGILSTGLDILVLEDKTDTLIPPDRLNILSLESLIDLFQSNGFEIKELSTPGVLDLASIKKHMNSNKNDIPNFLRYIFERRDTKLLNFFQDFLQENRLSSKVRLMAKKNN